MSSRASLHLLTQKLLYWCVYVLETIQGASIACIENLVAALRDSDATEQLDWITAQHLSLIAPMLVLSSISLHFIDTASFASILAAAASTQTEPSVRMESADRAFRKAR